ncbi:MAG: heme ABC exporter ATP-binding protein CcmA [Deltaproteobacteria bacterium]|nr:heme ABC exporter ATP-binding protein CcmA [Deltaproteobacteria bacterium]
MHLTIRSLAKAYGFLWALREVTIEFKPGDCVALLGPNGAGKTTLLKLLCGLLYPTSGAIELDGENLLGGPSRLRSMIGLLSPNEHFYENLTVAENLRFFGSLYGRRENLPEVTRILETVALESRAGEYVGSLSSGMKCRLAIAKSLLLKPTLLLLDEPYGALDGSGIDLLETYLRGLVGGGGIVVIASHHISRVLAVCNRALILHQGKLIFDEPKREPWLNFQRAFGEFLPRGERWSS